MMSVSTEAGQKLFGPKYKELNYYTIRHAVTAEDPRGDQGHSAPCFGTFHRAYLLELEETVLSIAPGVKALPYWDMALDFPGGRYHNSSKALFSPTYAGTRPALPEHNYQISDGLFPWVLVPYFNNVTYGQYAGIYNGARHNGLPGQLRGTNTSTTTKHVTAMPYKPVDVHMSFGEPYAPYTLMWQNQTLLGMNANYTQADYERCYDPTFAKNWTEWNFCIDYLSFIHNTEPTPEMVSKYTTTMSAFLHPYIHRAAGGETVFAPAGSGTVSGEMGDIATPSTDALVFIVHHANTDRNLMIWQKRAEEADKNIGHPSVMWGFPKSPQELPAVDPPYPQGTFLHDVVTSNIPFTDIFSPPNPKGFTHFDVIDRTRPGKAIYTYDNLA